jgi:peptide/nickel transport system ATP-binding protein
MAMILISHDLGVVARVADKVAVMYAGQVVESAGAQSLFRSPRHPYTRGLLNCIPVPGRTAPGSPLGAIPGQLPSLIGPQHGCAFRDRCTFAAPECAGDIPFAAVGPGHRARCIRLGALEAAA